MKKYIEIKIQLSIDKAPPAEAEIAKELERFRSVRKLSAVFVWILFAVAIAVCAAVLMLAPEYIIFAVIIISVGVFTALNGKDVLGHELKKLKPITADNFPEEYYELSQLSLKNNEITAYLISVSKLGRDPIYLEFLMLKDWFEGIPTRERLDFAKSVFTDISAQADASFRD